MELRLDHDEDRSAHTMAGGAFGLRNAQWCPGREDLPERAGKDAWTFSCTADFNPSNIAAIRKAAAIKEALTRSTRMVRFTDIRDSCPNYFLFVFGGHKQRRGITQSWNPALSD